MRFFWLPALQFDDSSMLLCRCAFAPHRCAFTQHSRITTTSLSPISSSGLFSYGAQERNLIHIMFGGVAGVLAAGRVTRVFASGCGFSKSKLGVP